MLFHRMNARYGQKRRGFTLVELAIVLGVASILFAGLWRLMASGSAQLRDQAAADQQRQLIAAISDYLASTNGQNLVAALGPSATAPLTLPASGAVCVAGNLCSFLPPGFSNITTNSYDQRYSVRVLKDGTAAGTYPDSYSYMILTYSGETIPDTSGGRISSMIGGDGGFVYDANVCGVNFACGAYGSWALSPVATYGFGSVTDGHVASRTYVTGGSSESPWLARKVLPGTDLGGGITEYNTIQTNLSLGDNIIYGDAGSTTGGSIEALQFLGLRSETTAKEAMYVETTGNANGTATAIFARGTCNENSVYPAESGSINCGWTVQVNGGQTVSGLLVASKLYASQFLYNTASDKRLKSNIKPVENALEKVTSLKGLSFNIKNEKRLKYGVLAQDVEKYFPELVNSIGEDYKGVDYMGLIGPIIGAVRELKEQNEALKEELDLLKKAVIKK